MCEECGKKCGVGIFKIRKTEEIQRAHIFLQSKHIFCSALSVVSWCICGRPKKAKLTASNVADEEAEVYSAEFVYESIYEEIPAEVDQVKVKPFLLL